ncbi:Heme oxygenase (mycobilin-producing) (Mycobacterial heme utilization [Durusdinium trenchii]|uniref:Degrader (MHUD n=1 Tax=Durusdinium trenchii TaxID=1381693 RepID=A0ABP0I1W2_9DINO
MTRLRLNLLGILGMQAVVVTTVAPRCLEEATHVVHLKGFGCGRFPEDGRGCCDLWLVEMLAAACGTSGVIAWDGDEFGEDSFTRILDKALSSRSIPAVAFYWRSLKDSFLESWQPRAERYSGGLHLVLLEENKTCGSPRSDASWVQLGIAALRFTRAKQVLSLGGGGVVAEEAAICAKDEQLNQVHWRLILLSRSGSTIHEVDYGSLYARFRAEKWSNFEHAERMNHVNAKAMNRFRVKDGLEEQFEQRWGNDRSISSLQGLRWFCLLRRVSSTPKSTGALSVVFDSDDEQFEDDYTYVSLGVWENQEAFSGAGGMLQEAGEDSASFASMVASADNRPHHAFKGVVTTSGAPKPALWDGMLLEKAKAMQNSKAAPFIVMNRFVVKAGSEVEFEERWANRESKLLEADGFQFFQLLRRVKTPDDDVNYISMSAWADRGAFDKWWEGKSFANMAQVQGNLLEGEIVRYFYEGVLVVEGDKGL